LVEERSRYPPLTVSEYDIRLPAKLKQVAVFKSVAAEVLNRNLVVLVSILVREVARAILNTLEASVYEILNASMEVAASHHLIGFVVNGPLSADIWGLNSAHVSGGRIAPEYRPSPKGTVMAVQGVEGA
jgi:hypothetical protein